MNLQTINAAASPEVQMNENFAVLDWATVYAMAAPTTSGLTWGYFGGRWSGFLIAAGALTLTNTATNYVVVNRATGAISVSTSATNWNDSAYARVYKLTVAGGVVTAIEDHRAGPYGIISGVTPSVMGPVGATTNHFAQFADTTGQLLKGGIALSTSTTLTENSDTVLASQKAVKAYADALIAAADAMVYKGATDCSANPNYPAADAGWTYRVSVAGKIGGASGKVVEIGDWFVCNTDGTASGAEATVGTKWNVIQTNLDGAVIGPASAVDLRVAVFDGTTGKLIKDGGVLLASAVLSTAAQGLSDAAKANARANIGALATGMWATSIGATIAASTTSYATPGDRLSTVVELDRTWTMVAPLIVSRMKARTQTAQPATGTLKYTLRKNNVDTALTFTIAAGAPAGYYADDDPAHAITFAENDLLSISIINAATAVSAIPGQLSLMYCPPLT